MFRQELPNLCVEYQSNEALAGTRAVPRISRSDLVLWPVSDLDPAPVDVRFWESSGRRLLHLHKSANAE